MRKLDVASTDALDKLIDDWYEAEDSGEVTGPEPEWYYDERDETVMRYAVIGDTEYTNINADEEYREGIFARADDLRAERMWNE